MKKFFQFLSEAQESKAIQQAKRMGLDTDQHGGWYKNGEFVAKTVNGELKFYNKRQKIGEKDSKQSEKEKNLSYSSTDLSNSQVQQEPIPGSSPEQTTVPQETTPTNYLPVEKTKGTLTIAYGRFNPPHAGHLQLMDTAASSAESEGSDYVIVPSRTQDKNKDPLDVDTKVSIMRKMFPQHSERIVNDSNTSTIFDVLKKAHNDGYANVRIIGGPNRVKEFEKLTNGYNGNLYQFDTIEVMPIGEKDADSDKAEDFSASRMRLAAAENDFKTFRSGMPAEMRPKEIRDIFNTVRQSMGIQDEVVEVWKIAPKLDWKNLRENYIHERIYQVGELVENLNTGLVGKIIRRGTNYLICVTEDNIMFKSWIKDVKESYQEKSVNSKMRLPGKPNTLVGTVGYLKYVAQQTPGSELDKENLAFGQKNFGLNFINKYRKSK
jgi:phosphopantetheine adenylyltransferase